jgi:predicted nucleic-acid-binding Zn-ribbon protein
MMARSNQCPKCRGAMTEGFVIDNTHGGRAVSSWLEGAPKKSMWVGVLLNGKKAVEITTLRCASCGFLESYAKPH